MATRKAAKKGAKKGAKKTAKKSARGGSGRQAKKGRSAATSGS